MKWTAKCLTAPRHTQIPHYKHPHIAVDPAFSSGREMGNYFHDPGAEGIKSLILCRGKQTTSSLCDLSALLRSL